MATKTIAWKTGSGNITLTYTGQGNGSISVVSDENDSFDDRSQSFDVVTTNGSPEKAVSILVKQQGKRYEVGEVFNFGYTGSVQEITLPKGKYKLQCWGAQGGTSYNSPSKPGSKGGYSEGVLTLSKTTTLYIFVGGKGSMGSTTSLVNGGWNGGGASVGKSAYNSGGIYGDSYPACGGGATDISTVTSSMSYSSGRTNRSSASLLARFIVAGGGAGGSSWYKSETTTTTSWEGVNTLSISKYWTSGTSYIYYIKVPYSDFEAGCKYRFTANDTGNLERIVISYYNSSSQWMDEHVSTSSPLTATIKNNNASYLEVSARYSTEKSSNMTIKVEKETSNTSTSTSSGYSNQSQQGGGTSGKGQYPGTQTSAGTGGGFGYGASQSSTNYRYCGGGGGGGWYGGGTGQSDSSTSYVNYSGGGSGFVNTSANASSRPSGYTGLQLDSGTTTAGNVSHPSTSGGTETGHSGNGYARITVVE